MYLRTYVAGDDSDSSDDDVDEDAHSERSPQVGTHIVVELSICLV
jgi:hypothetical protein